MGTISSETLLAALRHRQAEALQWLRRLVEVNSFTANAEGVNRVAELTVKMFAELGFAAEMVPSENPNYGQHVFLSRKPSTGESTRPIVLVTHSDTVFPPEEEGQNGFHWQESPDEGRIYGPGTVDNKGGTVLIWMMLRAIRGLLPDLFERGHWLVASNASEEVVATDFARLTKERCQQGAGAVLVFEGGPRAGGDYQIVTARKGRAEFRIKAEGKAAHAGSSHADGVNAVVELAKLLPLVDAMTDPARELTVNVAKVNGGTVLNRVPHEAAAELEMRAYDPAALAAAEQSLQALCHGHSKSARLSLECLGRTAAWPCDGGTRKLFSLWEAAAAELGLTAAPILRGGLSDANYLHDLGPVLDGLGPAGANAHCSIRSADGKTVPEYVEPGSFVPKAAMNVLAMMRLLEATG